MAQDENYQGLIGYWAKRGEMEGLVVGWSDGHLVVLRENGVTAKVQLSDAVRISHTTKTTTVYPPPGKAEA